MTLKKTGCADENADGRGNSPSQGVIALDLSGSCHDSHIREPLKIKFMSSVALADTGLAALNLV
jgi:hypothetical protein